MDAFRAFVLKLSSVLISPILKLLMAVAILVFIVSVAQYLLDSENVEKHKEYFKRIIYSLIGFAILISISAIMNLLANAGRGLF